MATDIIASKLGAGLPVSPFKSYATLYRALDREALTGALSGEPIARYTILSREQHGVTAALFRMPISLGSPFNPIWLNIGGMAFVELVANDERRFGRDTATFANPFIWLDDSLNKRETLDTALRVINALGACAYATVTNVGWVMERRQGGYLLTSTRHDGVIHQHLFDADYVGKPLRERITLDLTTGEFFPNEFFPNEFFPNA